MAAPSDISIYAQRTPTTGPTQLVDAAGAALSLVVTNADPNPAGDLEFGVDAFFAQGQTGPAEFVDSSGAALDFTDEVQKPYSVTTPPGVIVVG